MSSFQKNYDHAKREEKNSLKRKKQQSEPHLDMRCWNFQEWDKVSMMTILNDLMEKVDTMQE